MIAAIQFGKHHHLLWSLLVHTHLTEIVQIWPKGATSHRSLKSLQKSPDSSHSQGTSRSLSISSEPSGRQQDCKAAYQASQHLKKHSSVKWRGAAASDSHLLDSLPLERLKLETGSLQFGKQPSFLTRSQDHQSSRSKEEIILDYNSSHLKSTVAGDSPTETTKGMQKHSLPTLLVCMTLVRMCWRGLFGVQSFVQTGLWSCLCNLIEMPYHLVLNLNRSIVFFRRLMSWVVGQSDEI